MSKCEFGRLTVTVDGERFSARGAFEIKPNNFEREAASNMDATMYTNVKLMPAEATGSFDGCTAENFDAMLNACDMTVVFEIGSPANPIVWIFTNAVLSGRPNLNTETGEVSDITFNSEEARRG